MRKITYVLFGVLIGITFALSLNVYGASAASAYINVNGTAVHVPIKAIAIPKGSTAQCKDYTYSFSKHRSGTCSGHKGVLKWF